MILINPHGQKLKGFYRYLPISPHIGIGFLAAYLRKQGKAVKILDENVNSITEDLIDSYMQDLTVPYIFGISCVTAAVNRGYRLAKILKARYPDAKIIFGGMHPTVLPEEALNTGYVDIVVRGEGEEILSNLYDAIKTGRDYSSIKGISFKNNGRIAHNPNAPVISNLSSLPPFPYDLFRKISDKYTLGFVVSSRGCPYDCIFCSQRLISGRLYRYASSSRVIEEIDLLVNKYNQKSIVFVDDNFLVDKKRTKELCNLIIERKLHEKSSFHCQARGDSVDADILQHLKSANFKYIDFGLETASERLMKLINKCETVQDNINAVRLAKQFGFRVNATFIFGLPTETKADRLSAYKLAKKLDIDFARFNNATPYPGTRLFEIARQESALNTGKNWENLNACGSLVGGYFNKSRLAFVPKGTDEKELKRDVFKANLFFYLRPKSIIRIFKEKMIPAGWFVLPPRWYIKPKEWYNIIRFMAELLLPKKEEYSSDLELK